MIDHSDDETNFPNKLLLTDKQFLRICKPFPNNSSTNIKLSKNQLSKMVGLRGYLGRLLGPLLKSG